MNTMKKILAVLLIAAIAASFAACASKRTSNITIDPSKASSISAQSKTKNASADAQSDSSSAKPAADVASSSQAGSKAAAKPISAKAGTKAADGAKSTQAVSTDKQSGGENDVVTGGWEYNQGEFAIDQNADAKAAFEKAIKGLVGCDYEAIALIGSQVVAGTNYCILCKTTPVYPNAVSSYVLLYIYADLAGNAEITDEKDFAEGSDSDEPIVGGLNMNQGDFSVDKNADVKAAFDKALDGLVGCKYETVAYIGSQVVAGTNYVILCRTTPVYPDAVSVFSLVTVYVDLQGNAELSDVTDLSI
jgi:hypothetical protein